ncbi:Fruit bromelain [Linum perenne]
MAPKNKGKGKAISSDDGPAKSKGKARSSKGPAQKGEASSSKGPSQSKHKGKLPHPKDVALDGELWVDWTDMNWIRKKTHTDRHVILSPVRRQGDYLTCSAFAVSAYVEAAHNIKNCHKFPVQLSVQELIDCVEPLKNKSRESQLKKTLRWVRDNKLSLEQHWPHVEKKHGGPGPQRRKRNPIMAKGIGPYDDGQGNPVNEQTLITMVVEKPIIVLVDWVKEFKDWDGKGIYEGVPLPAGREEYYHAILVVGYGTDQVTGTHYWKIRNSTGLQFGNDGYGLISRACNSSSGTTLFKGYGTAQALQED